MKKTTYWQIFKDDKGLKYASLFMIFCTLIVLVQSYLRNDPSSYPIAIPFVIIELILLITAKVKQDQTNHPSIPGPK